MEKIGILVELEGAKTFNDQIYTLNASIKALGNQSKMLESEFAAFSSSAAGVEEQNKVLSSTLTELSRKLEIQREHYAELEADQKTEAKTLAYWRGEIAKTETQLAEMESRLAGFDSAVDRGSQAVATYSAELNRLNAYYTAHDSAVLKSTQNQAVLTRAIASQGEVVDSLTAKYELYKTKFGELDARTLKVKQSLEEARIKLKELHNEFNKNSILSVWGKQAQAAGEKIQSIGKGIATVGTTISKYISLPLLAIGALSVKSASDFESAFANVTKVLDATEGELEAIKTGIEKMSTETASSKESIAETVATVGRLGVAIGEGGENILKFTKTMIQLGDTTDMETEEIANALGKFVAVTGMSQDEVDRLGSAIISLGNHFAASESEIIPMMQKMAAAGTIAGLTEQEIAGLSTALAATGVKAEAGGTSMTKVFQTLNKAVTEFANGTTEKVDLISKLAGVSSKEFADAWRNEPMKALQMFFDGLNTVTDDSIKLDEVLGTLGIKQIRQSVSVKNLAKANEMLSDAVEMANTEFEKNDALTIAANKRYQTFAARLSQLKETAKNTANEFGELLLPTLEKMMESVRKTVEAWGKMSDAEKKNIIQTAKWIAIIGGTLTVAGKTTVGIGKVTEAVGKLSEKLGDKGLSSKFVEVNGGSVQFVGALGKVTAALPYLAIAAGVAAIALERYKNSYAGMEAAHQKEMEALKQEYEEYDSTSEKVSNLVNRLDELQNKDQLTAAEKGEVASIVRTLNSEVENLNLTYDAATGKIDDYNGAIKENIDAITRQFERTKKLQKLEKMYNDLYDAIEDYNTISKEKEEADKKLAGANTKIAGQTSYYAREVDILTNKQTVAKEKVDELQIAYDDEAESLDTLSASTDAASESTSSFGDVSEDTTDTLSEEADATEDAREEYEKLAQSISDANDKKREGFELFDIEKQKYSDLKEALQSQINAFSNYNTNLETVKQYVEGLDGAEQDMARRLLEYTAAMGIDGAGYMQTLADTVNNDEEAFMGLARMLGEVDVQSAETSAKLLDIESNAQGLTTALGDAADTTGQMSEKAYMMARETAKSASTLKSDVDRNMSQLPKITSGSISGMNTALMHGMSTATSKAGTGSAGVYNAVNAFTPKYALVGNYIADGLATGINQNAWKPISAAQKMAQAVNRVVEQVSKVASPSKFMKYIGKMDAMGLAVGIDENADIPVSSAERMASAVLGVSSSLFGKNNGGRRMTLSSNRIEMSGIYEAVKAGAEAAQLKTSLDGRLVSRELKTMGVQFA